MRKITCSTYALSVERAYTIAETGMGKCTAVFMNVSCDQHAASIHRKLGDIVAPEVRLDKIFAQIKKLDPDIVGLVELRESGIVEHAQQALHKLSYKTFVTRNNMSPSSFCNVMGVKLHGEWLFKEHDCLWCDVRDDVPCLSGDPEARVPGDRHGRTVCYVQLQHKHTGEELNVMAAHVVPFPVATKQIQRVAILNHMTTHTQQRTAPWVVMGDLNTFQNEREEWNTQLATRDLHELKKECLHIGDRLRVTDNVFTFVPWSVDPYYSTFLTLPMSDSNLDVVVGNSAVRGTIDVHAVMNIVSDKPVGDEGLLEMLGDKMASDHLMLHVRLEF